MKKSKKNRPAGCRELVDIRNGRAWSYFSNVVVQQLEMSLTVWWGGGSFQRQQHCRLCQKELRLEGIFVYVLRVKLVHFIYIVFLHILLSRELWIHLKCTIFFYPADELLSPTRFSCTYFFHLGPKTADRISIFDFVLILPLVCCTVIQIVNLLFIFLCWIFTGQKYFPQQFCKII